MCSVLCSMLGMTVPDPQGRFSCKGRCASVQHSFFAGQGGTHEEDLLEEVSSWEAENVNGCFPCGNNTVISLTTLS